MQARRGPAARRDLCRGPGRLCTALSIDASLDGTVLGAGGLELVPAGEPARIGLSTRIRITKAAEERLRFYLRGSPYLSGPRGLSP